VEALMGTRAGSRALVGLSVKTPDPRPAGRVCQHEGCVTVLSIYNVTAVCAVHSSSKVDRRWVVVGTDWVQEWADTAQGVLDAEAEGHVAQWALAEMTFKALKAGVKATELAARARRDGLPGKYRQDISKFKTAWERFGSIPLDRRPGLWDAVKTPIGEEPTNQYTRTKGSMNNPLKACRRLVKLLSDGQALAALKPEEHEELLLLVPTLRSELDQLESGELVAVAS
jgi:hypothetical protein